MDIDKYPYPIAHAYRLANDDNYGATVKHINAIGCAYQALRFCSLVFAGWYLYRLPRQPAVQKALHQLRRPTMGQWVSFIRTSLKTLFTEEQSTNYLPLSALVKAVRTLETMRWDINSLTPNPAPELLREALPPTTALDEDTLSHILIPNGLAPFAWFTQHRNTHHGHFATLTDEEAERALDGVLPKLQELLEVLSCLSEYQLVHRDSATKITVLLSGDEGKDFRVLDDVPDELFTSEEFLREDEQIALIYPNDELAIPLTHLVTREQEKDSHEGLVRFKTATIAKEPLLYDGVDYQTKQIVYLGSGTRSLRASSFEAVNNLFGNQLLYSETGSSVDPIDHLRQEAENQLNLLYGVKYQPHFYVQRDIDYKLKQTLTKNSANEKPCVLLIGASGSGKSNFLCRLADELLSTTKNKHQVSLRLAEVIGSKQTLSLEHGLAVDLGYRNAGENYDLSDLLEFWSSACARRKIKNPTLWILWDALNEGHDLETLLKWVDESARVIKNWNADANSFGKVRLVISCRSEPWEQLVKRVESQNPDDYPLKNLDCFQNEFGSNSKNRVLFWSLPKFGLKQARLAYEKYKDWAILSHAPHSRIDWNQLKPEHHQAMQIPLNVWLFHHTFDRLEQPPLGEINTAELWQGYLEHTVSRHLPMANAIELFGKLMWQNQRAALDADEVSSFAKQEFAAEQQTQFAQLGLTPDAFSALPVAVQNALHGGNFVKHAFLDPVELLVSAGLILLNYDGILTPTYQTLSESIAGWVLWREVLPQWNVSDRKPLKEILRDAQRQDAQILQERLKPWLERGNWSEGRRALLQFWAWCAEDALQQNLFDAAKTNLAELQLRGYAGSVIDLIETHLPDITKNDFRLYLVSLLIDMIHLRGEYQRAAEMIQDELARNSEIKNQPLSLISLQIRSIHHQMFYRPVTPLYDAMNNLREKFNVGSDEEKYGEILFMLGGNLGTLRGDYRHARALLLDAVRIGQKTGDDYLTCRSLRKYADFLRYRGHLRFAREIWNKAWILSESRQQTRQGIYLLCCLGDLERQQGDFEQSEKTFEKALTAARTLGISGWIGHAYLGLAELRLAQTRLEEATLNLEQALKFYRQIDQCWGEIQVCLGHARVKLLQGDSQWTDFAKTAANKAQEFGYQRDYHFAGQVLNLKQPIDNCLMFL